MSNITIEKIGSIKGKVFLPGDKSISHRSVMISSLANGVSRINNMLMGFDCQATIGAFQNMGIVIDIENNNSLIVYGKGLNGLKPPDKDLYLGNSGTTMRLLLGILAGQNFRSVLTGDESLSNRPMKRVTDPLHKMGADIDGRDGANFAPLTINGARIKSIDYKTPMASAQVKSALLFAGLYADGVTAVTEPFKSRDHTERMLRFFGVDVVEKGLTVSLQGPVQELKARDLIVPGDISSAAFFIALGILAKNSEIIIKDCGINPTRIGILNVLKRMGAIIDIINIKEGFEPSADIAVKSSKLKAVHIAKDEIPLLIDEIPIISLIAAFAEGTTIIEGAGELRVKETDRIESIVTNLKLIGVNIAVDGESLIINGPCNLTGAKVNSFGDHRIAMMLIIAGALAKGRMIVSDIDCISVSFPGFMDVLEQLINVVKK